MDIIDPLKFKDNKVLTKKGGIKKFFDLNLKMKDDRKDHYG